MTIDEITRHADVAVSPDRAWSGFVTDLALWWPREHCFCGEAALERVYIDLTSRLWGERTRDGRVRIWGAVIESHPGRSLSLGWQMDASTSPWLSEPDPQRASRIDVTFAARPGGGTRVTLRHHGFSAQPEPAAGAMRAVIIGLDRWGEWLPLYAASLPARGDVPAQGPVAGGFPDSTP